MWLRQGLEGKALSIHGALLPTRDPDNVLFGTWTRTNWLESTVYPLPTYLVPGDLPPLRSLSQRQHVNSK